jgi:hypothetical protein
MIVFSAAPVWPMIANRASDWRLADRGVDYRARVRARVFCCCLSCVQGSLLLFLSQGRRSF